MCFSGIKRLANLSWHLQLTTKIVCSAFSFFSFDPWKFVAVNAVAFCSFSLRQHGICALVNLIYEFDSYFGSTHFVGADIGIEPCDFFGLFATACRKVTVPFWSGELSCSDDCTIFVVCFHRKLWKISRTWLLPLSMCLCVVFAFFFRCAICRGFDAINDINSTGVVDTAVLLGGVFHLWFCSYPQSSPHKVIMDGHVYMGKSHEQKCLLLLTDAPRLLCIDSKTYEAKMDASCHELEVVCAFLVDLILMTHNESICVLWYAQVHPEMDHKFRVRVGDTVYSFEECDERPGIAVLWTCECPDDTPLLRIVLIYCVFVSRFHPETSCVGCDTQVSSILFRRRGSRHWRWRHRQWGTHKERPKENEHFW